MDYVVAGFGIGAVLALIGFALWELFGTTEEPGKSWLSRAAIGLMLGSLVLWAITAVSLVSHLEDSMGTQIILMTTLVTLISVAAGSYWYWRVDRELVAHLPKQRKVSPQREIPVAAAVAAQEDLELSEWDDWPDRDAGQPVEPQMGPVAPEPAVAFEPEVAVEAPDAPGLKDDVEAASYGPRIDISQTEIEAESDEATVEPFDSASVLPANARPFRAPTRTDATPDAAQVEVDDVVLAESISLDEVKWEPDTGEPEEPDGEVAALVEDVAVAEIELEPLVESNLSEIEPPLLGPEVPLVEKEDAPADEEDENERGTPSGFESALLADVDASLVDESGGYRSPLLADLGPDKLEGVGLAKWRQDARLTDEEEEDDHPRAKSQRGR